MDCNPVGNSQGAGVRSLQYCDTVVPITCSDGPSTIVMESVHRLCLKHSTV